MAGPRDALMRWLRRGSSSSRSLPGPESREGPASICVVPSEATRELASVSPRIQIAPPPEAADPGAYVYAPDRREGVLGPFQLQNVLLSLSHQALDFVVVSHGFDEAPRLRIASPRDATVFSARAWSALASTGRLPEGARGRVLRLLPGPLAPDDLVETRVDALGFGPLRVEGAELQAPGSAGPVARRRPGTGLLAAIGGVRPTVLVLPTMMAVGGVERNLIEIVAQLGDRYSFVIATTERLLASRGSLNHQALPHCQALFELGELGPPELFLPMLETLARTYRPDLIWICNGSPWLLSHSVALRRLFADVPIVDQQVYDTQVGWIEHYADPGIGSFDRFIAINQQIRRVFQERIRIPAERIDLVYHAIDAGRFRPEEDPSRRAAAARELGLPTDRPLLGMVGRLTVQKRPLVFLELARRARDAQLGIEFVLVGDGELARDCDAFIAAHRLSNVHRIPYCDDMSRFFPLLDGLLICSEYEGLPISMLEALATGVPVLSTRVGDVPLVLAEFGSGHVLGAESDDPEGWLEALRAFLRDLPGLRERARAAAPEIARRFSAEAGAAAYARSWSRAIEEFEPRRSGPPAVRVEGLPPISVVIPTYNRVDLLVDTLQRCRACAGPVELEFVVIDDGSRDETPKRLEELAHEIPNLTWRSIPNGGPGHARNLGASLAKHDLILFLGDDIQPKDDRFFVAHAELHRRQPERSFAAIGKTVWPNRPGGDVNFVMAHVQGRHGEQFGFADLHPYSFLDWRFFYTANVSVKRALVDDWLSEGFSRAFSLAAYEDAEFAYRMMRRPDPLRIFYTPASVGSHHHPFSVDAFMSRQLGAGLMARVFLDLHPTHEVREMIGLGVAHALATPAHPVGSRNAADFLSVIEGVKSWVRLIDQHQQLGSQWWHGDLLYAVFRLCYLQGFITGSATPAANVSAAYYLILDEFVRSMNHAIHAEITGRALGRHDIESLFSLTPSVLPALSMSPLRRWATRRPTLVRGWRFLRRQLRGR